MNTAEKIYETVKQLPEQQAADVLHFAEMLKAKGSTAQGNNEADFFELAGIWQGRKVTKESLRALAWRDTAK